MAFHVGHVCGWNARWDDCVVVGYLRRVEYLFRLRQRFACQWLCKRFIASQVGQCLRTLGVDVVTEKGGVYTRVCSEFLFIKTLYDVERHLCAHAKLVVAVNLKRCQVVKRFWRLLAVLLLNIGYGERLSCDCLKKILSFFLCSKLTFRCCEYSVAVCC